MYNYDHFSGCSASCNGIYYFGGNKGQAQPYSKDCWCPCGHGKVCLAIQKNGKLCYNKIHNPKLGSCLKHYRR